MEDDLLSRAATVSDPRAGAVFADSQLRRILMLFAARPRSVGEAAAGSGLDLKRLHYFVQKLHRLRLLEVAEVRRRAGRGVRLYRTSHDAFFIPEEMFPVPFSDGLLDEMREALALDARLNHRGVLFAWVDGRPVGRMVTNGPSTAAAMQRWRILKLAPKQATALKDEVEAVLDRYERTAAGEGAVYLVHASMVRRRSESASVDNARD